MVCKYIRGLGLLVPGPVACEAARRVSQRGAALRGEHQYQSIIYIHSCERSEKTVLLLPKGENVGCLERQEHNQLRLFQARLYAACTAFGGGQKKLRRHAEKGAESI